MYQQLISPITQALSATLQFFYGFAHDYTLAIVLLTLAVKLVLHPLTRTQLKSMKGMQVVAPHVEALRRKYKEDPQTLNREIMQLYRAHKVNPAMGCLPMIVQMPVFIALWQLLYKKGLFGTAAVFGIPWMRLDQAPNLSQIMSEVGTGHPERLLLLIFPVLIFVTMWLQQRMTITDPQQARMLILMPVMMAWFATIYPVGVSIYMIVSTMAYLGEYLWVVGRPHPMITAPPKSQIVAQAQASGNAKQPASRNSVQPAPVPKGKKGAKRR
ncbi:MAG TPA: YidC/Oxa1 family membrane protein insertase [bacterium]|nr:YidC/Oxa1 family membrane protein insertase [bacterium]